MKIGYARTSTLDQNLDLQLDALKNCGCEKIYQEQISSVKDNRPQLENCLQALRAGDTLYIWRLDRLGRSLKDLINIVTQLQEMDCELVSIKESIDTSTTSGKLTFHLFASLAEFERELIRERTQAGLLSARARGRMGGRPEKLKESEKKMIRQLMSDRQNSASKIAKQFGVSRATVYNVAKGVQLRPFAEIND
ncbi:recombinase family protein (plasmid) [Moraxella atlantae]|uniref:recombinase family protein n=1 Tax=Faucicola atlantae TaxID=34059 RepID=UPI003753101A